MQCEMEQPQLRNSPSLPLSTLGVCIYIREQQHESVTKANLHHYVKFETFMYYTYYIHPNLISWLSALR